MWFCNEWVGLNDSEKGKYFSQILLSLSGLQIKYRSVKSALQEIRNKDVLCLKKKFLKFHFS